MDQKAVSNLTIRHLEQEFRKLGSKNDFCVKQFGESAPYWITPTDNPNFTAGKAATRKVYDNHEPDLTREGGRLVNRFVLWV